MLDEAAKVIQVSATWETELRSFWVAFFTLGVLLLAAGFAGWQLWHARKERELRFVIELRTIWDSSYLEEGRKTANTYSSRNELFAAMRKFEDMNDRFYYVLLRVPAVFETIGVACEKDKRLLPLVKEMLRSSVIYYFDLYQPWIQARVSSTQYENFKRLRERMGP